VREEIEHRARGQARGAFGQAGDRHRTIQGETGGGETATLAREEGAESDRSQAESHAIAGDPSGYRVTFLDSRKKCARPWIRMPDPPGSRNRGSFRGGARRRTNLTIFDHLTSAGQLVGTAHSACARAKGLLRKLTRPNT
jgi:hypothetical protein